ncbi:hypothetical protein [Euzebya tangerina]|uniref:hypothetical protein n=1 Tax=Euzebya tangerina TaxID=591198 RepID=UPI0013C3787B|nr:hypothetical protein [Euzebya tangerina]
MSSQPTEHGDPAAADPVEPTPILTVATLLETLRAAVRRLPQDQAPPPPGRPS